MHAATSVSHEPTGHSVLIVEPSEVVRTGLAIMANSIPFVTRTVTCDGITQAFALLRSRRVTTMMISESFGAKRTGLLRREAERQRTKYLVTVYQGSEPIAPDALDMVTHGVVLLDNVTVESLTDILNCLSMDQAVLPAPLLKNMLDRSVARQRSESHSPPMLTQRELQVLSFLADGLSNKQIARRITISEHGVKRHVANVLNKLNCPNRTQAVSCAIQGGILAPLVSE
ncbi:MAG TPA: response regulator transcription factor [Streptosporangiaceae bacterium]|nr:response regulator transcription factor [Streptosporangiaceae bacterium]